MIDKTQKLREYSFRVFYDGFDFGIASTTAVAGMVDYLSDKSFDHPYLIGIPFVASVILGLHNRARHGIDNGLKKLEKLFDD